MDEYLGRGIKDVIKEFPEVGDILEEYGIGCVPCAVGTCLLKDVIEIHDLTPELERAMMARVALAIDPNATVDLEAIEAALAAPPEPVAAPSRDLAPPLQVLVDEHVLIKRMIALLPRLIGKMDLDTEEGRQVVRDALDFIRAYADRHHHGKEEDILLGYFDPDLEIIKTIHEDHTTGRAHVRAAADAVETGDRKAVAENLAAYRGLLTEHITKEDGILFPWIERKLTGEQLAEVESSFDEAEGRAPDVSERYERLVASLEQKLTAP